MRWSEGDRKALEEEGSGGFGVEGVESRRRGGRIETKGDATMRGEGRDWMGRRRARREVKRKR